MRISVFLPDNVDLTSIIHHIYAYTQYAILKFAQKIRPLQGFLEVQVSKTRIDIFFANNLNISETARKLYVHRNTLVYRLEKLRQLTGLDIRTFDDAMTFRIALMVTGYVRDRENQENK